MSSRVVVVGLSYVGLSLAVLLADKHHVVGIDIDEAKVDALRGGVSPIADDDIQTALRAGLPTASWRTEPGDAYADADVVFVATPTNYDEATSGFDTGSVDHVCATAVAAGGEATIVIKSTVPVGYTAAARQRLGTERLVFSPEFLREGRALADNRSPSRIVVGDRGARGQRVSGLLAAAADNNPPVLLTGSTEAEAIKLFSNTYLAMRVAYFNELDTYAATHGLRSADIVAGVGLDPRIGDHYNNPSFGYGGYCLPKDAKQLLANYADVPQTLIEAIVTANATRADFIASEIADTGARSVGIYRLAMKTGSDNYRGSSVQAVIARLIERGITVRVYEPGLDEPTFLGAKVVPSLGALLEASDVVAANRVSPELEPYRDKVYTRDLFGRD